MVVIYLLPSPLVHKTCTVTASDDQNYQNRTKQTLCNSESVFEQQKVFIPRGCPTSDQHALEKHPNEKTNKQKTENVIKSYRTLHNTRLATNFLLANPADTFDLA